MAQMSNSQRPVKVITGDTGNPIIMTLRVMANLLMMGANNKCRWFLICLNDVFSLNNQCNVALKTGF